MDTIEVETTHGKIRGARIGGRIPWMSGPPCASIRSAR